jgi:hypothetical protein
LRALGTKSGKLEVINIAPVENEARKENLQKSPVEEGAKGSKPTQAKDQCHQPAKQIEETARLASSVATNKDLEKVRKAKD